MIDRFAARRLSASAVIDARSAAVPKESTVFEGHFPGLSADAGRAADRMHGADHRLARDRAQPASPPAVLAGVKEGKFRSRRVSRRRARIRRQGHPRRLRLRRRRSQRTPQGRDRSATRSSPTASFPIRVPELRAGHGGIGRSASTSRLKEFCEVSRTRARCGSPASVSHLPWRGARSGLEPSRARRSAALRRQELRALHRASARRR